MLLLTTSAWKVCSNCNIWNVLTFQPKCPDVLHRNVGAFDFVALVFENLETKWEEYPVFHLDFNVVDFIQEGVLDNRMNKWLSEHETVYGWNPNILNQGDCFPGLLKAAHHTDFVYYSHK